MGVPTFLQRPSFPDERRHQFADTVSWTKGRHSFKFGLDFARTHDLSQNLRFQYGSYNYSNIGNYLSDFYKPTICAPGPNAPCYSTFQQASGPLAFAFNPHHTAFFAEDICRILPPFTLILG